MVGIVTRILHGKTLYATWLRHTDARQVSDLPYQHSRSKAVYDLEFRVGDPSEKNGDTPASQRLPRIGVAEPTEELPLKNW